MTKPTVEQAEPAIGRERMSYGPMVTPLVRALSLLGGFTPHDALLSNGELAERSGLPRSTVSRIMQSLTALGYLHYEPDQRKYRLTASVLNLGYAAIAGSELLRLARPKMREFAEQQRVHVNLSTRDRLDMIVVGSYSTKQAPASLSFQVGTRFGLATSPMGWAFLAGLPDVERYYLLGKLEPRVPLGWQRQRRRCDEAIAQVLDKGFCTSVREWNIELGIIAVPLLVAGHEPMVLSCVGSSSQMMRIRVERELGPRLRGIASALQRESTRQYEVQYPNSTGQDRALSVTSYDRVGGRPSGRGGRTRSHTASGPAPSGTEGTSSILTVERGLQVLRCFRANRMPLSNKEIVQRSGLSKATVSRLTNTLRQVGFLRHESGGRKFELSTGPLAIGHAFVDASPLLRRAEPFMQDLADKLNVSVALALGDQLEMLYIGYCISRRIATLRLGVGSLLPMATTAIGHAWLWGLPTASQEQHIDALRRDAGPDGDAVERGIRESFAELASTGVCSVLGGYQRDAYGIALPVRIGFQQTPMALSCGAAGAELDLAEECKRIVPELRKAAVQLESLLADLDGRP